MAKKTLIKCPNCGCEYVPAEIYIPDTFFGRPTQVFKDEKGIILGITGTDMDMSEEYECDNCGKKFTVDASMAFKTNIVDDIFEEDAQFTKEIREAKNKK